MCTPTTHASTPIPWLAGATLGWHVLEPASKGRIFVKFGINDTVTLKKLWPSLCIDPALTFFSEYHYVCLCFIKLYNKIHPSKIIFLSEQNASFELVIQLQHLP